MRIRSVLCNRSLILFFLLMSFHTWLGKAGEEEALYYLTLKGYRLLARNWRVGRFELDIVAEWFGTIVFIEVKTRSPHFLESGLTAVDEQKQRNLTLAAEAFIHYENLKHSPLRFDILELIGEAPPFQINHYEEAFIPAPNYKL